MKKKMFGSGPRENSPLLKSTRLAVISKQFSRLLWAATLAMAALTADAEQADTRKLFDTESPSWLRAIGKLQVPGVKYKQGYPLNYREDCSATLITSSKSAAVKETSADTIITAWHCLEFYSDLSKTITFTLLYGTKQSITRSAYRISAGDNMNGDWAVLRLSQSVPTSSVAALRVHPGAADRQRAITMAGYSKNSPGERLSYDPDCSIIMAEPARQDGITSNCKALKGASGGAVVQLSAQGEPLLAGVISQGDGQNMSVFVPVDEFRSAIQASLR